MSEARSTRQVVARRTVQELIIGTHRDSGRGIVDLWRYYGESAEDAGEQEARKFLLAVGACDFEVLRQLGAVVGPSGPVDRFSGTAVEMIERYNLAACWMDCVNADDGTVDEDLVASVITVDLQASMPWKQTLGWLLDTDSTCLSPDVLSPDVRNAFGACVTLMIEEYDDSLWDVFCNTVPRSDLFTGIVGDDVLSDRVPNLLSAIWELGNPPHGSGGTVSVPVMTTVATSGHARLDGILRDHFTIAELVRFAPVDKVWEFLCKVFQMFVNEGDEVFEVLDKQVVATGGDGDGAAEADVLGGDKDDSEVLTTPPDNEPVRESAAPVKEEAEPTRADGA